jgi:Fur family ferric uptake transcriptional regulator
MQQRLSNYEMVNKTSRFGSQSGKSVRKGPLRWEWSYRLFAVIEKTPEITAEQLQTEGALLGIEISLRTAFRFMRRYRENQGDLFKSGRTHLQTIAGILQNVPAGEHLTPLDIQAAAAEGGVILHLTTVYRILQKLVASGTVVQLDKERKTFYEWKRDELHHGHLTCVVCGRTIEFHQDYLDSLARHICTKFNYEYQRFDFSLRACCPNCR